jgi:hypothetical protein
MVGASSFSVCVCLEQARVILSVADTDGFYFASPGTIVISESIGRIGENVFRESSALQ